ncbi:hypothetical protein MRX96_025944 [Rhipicephalus microplus]
MPQPHSFFGACSAYCSHARLEETEADAYRESECENPYLIDADNKVAYKSRNTDEGNLLTQTTKLFLLFGLPFVGVKAHVTCYSAVTEYSSQFYNAY